MAETKSYKVLVFGGAGFIGSNLVDELLRQGHKVTVVDDLSSGKAENLNPKAIFIKHDIRESLDSLVAPDYVFHLAAIPRVPFSVSNPELTHDVNVNGTLNILMWALRNSVKKVIFASSSSVYGDQKLPLNETMTKHPKSPYALHKAIGEEYMTLFDTLYGLPTISLRFFNVYGPKCDPNSEYSLVIGKWLRMKKENKALTIFGDGEQSRDFTYVSDVVEGCIAAMEKPVHNEVINLCNGKATTLNTIASLIDKDPKVYLPPRQGDVIHTLGSPIKARKLLNWEGKVSVKEGISLLQKE